MKFLGFILAILKVVAFPFKLIVIWLLGISIMIFYIIVVYPFSTSTKPRSI